MEYTVSLQCVQDAALGIHKVPTFSDALNWLDSLSRSTGEQVETDSAPSGQREYAESELANALT
jgi:hypothetical protein